MEFSRQEYWSGVLFPSSGPLCSPGIKPASLVSPALIGWWILYPCDVSRHIVIHRGYSAYMFPSTLEI